MTLFPDSIADIVRQYLIDQELGVADVRSDWATFVSLLPDQPDKALCVLNQVGRFDGRLMRTGEQIEHPGVQVIVRGFDFPSGDLKSRQIALTFDAQTQNAVVVNGHRYTIQNISRTGPILPLGIGEDDRRRFHFSINAVLTLNEG